MQQIIEDDIKKKPMVLLEIGSRQCMPCKAIKQKIEHWLSLHKEVKFHYIAIEENPVFCSQMGIFSVPALLFYGEGKLILREAGYFSLEDVLHKIERFEEILYK